MASPHVAGRGRAPEGAPSRLDGRADQVGTRADRRPGHGRRAAPRRSRPVRAAASSTFRAPTCRCSSPPRPASRSAASPPTRDRDPDGHAHRCGRRRRRLDRRRRSFRPARHRLASRRPSRCPARCRSRQTAAAATGDVTGFVVLTRGADVRRIPFWFDGRAPKLGREAHIALTRAGTYRGTTKGGPSLVSVYRYPTGGDVTYAGPERAYRVRDHRASPANFGAVVTVGARRPPRHLRRGRGSPRRLHGPAAWISTRTARPTASTCRSPAPCFRRRACTTSSSTRGRPPAPGRSRSATG